MEEDTPEKTLPAIDELYDAIETEIRAEYQVLNKFSTEKFSIILILLGFLGIVVSAWPTIKAHVDLSEFFFLWTISICISLFIWAWSLFHATKELLNSENPKSVSVEIILRKLSEFGSVMFQNLKSNENEEHGPSKEEREEIMKELMVEMKSFTRFSIDYVAKNTEMQMRPILIFALPLIISAGIHIERYFEVSIPGFEQSTPLVNFPLVWVLLAYAVLFFLIGFWWKGISRIVLTIWSGWMFLLTKGFDLVGAGVTAWKHSRAMKNIFGDLLYKIKKSGVGIVQALLGVLLVIIWFVSLLSLLFILFFSLAFPIYLPVALIEDYGIAEFTHLIGRLFIVLFASYFLFRILEILFSIHLIERIKNDRIAWLKRLKIELRDTPEEDQQMIERAQEKISLSELYLPMPYTTLFAFTRYEIIPVLPHCGDDELVEERLKFLNSH